MDTTPINYYVFDTLYLDGYDLKGLTLEERKSVLNDLVQDNEIIRVSESFDDGEALYQLMQEKGWEGVVAKKKESANIENDRSNRWMKFPVQKIDELMIGVGLSRIRQGTSAPCSLALMTAVLGSVFF